MTVKIEIKPQRPHVEAIFDRYKSQLGDDLLSYKNHVYRTITYAMAFLGNQPQWEKTVETIFAYHDIGLWTDHQLAYLEPSEAVAQKDNEQFDWGIDPEILRNGIHWHHKITPYQGAYGEVIEACRKADWIDVSKGMLRKGLTKADIAAVEAQFPVLGFHEMLMRLAKDYGGSTVVGSAKVTLGIVKW